MLSTGLTFLTFLPIGDEELEAQKASKQNKLMKTETFPNNYQFKYLEKHKRKTKLHWGTFHCFGRLFDPQELLWFQCLWSVPYGKERYYNFKKCPEI